MEHIVIKVDSKDTSSAIKKFVGQFPDASIEDVMENEENYPTESYGLKKQEFENRLNTGIAESVLGITQPWSAVKEQLLAKINNK